MMGRKLARMVALGLLATFVACGEPEVVVPQTLWVKILPSHGADGISPNVQCLVYFTHAVRHASSLPEQVELRCAGAPPCNSPDASACSTATVDAALDYDAENQVARLTPDEALQEDTCYTVVVSQGIESERDDVAPLPVEVFSSFQTR